MVPHSPHILLVDDDPSFREDTLDARPLRENFQFDEASTTQKMWTLLDKNTYDLVLLDLDMNNNGIEAGLKQIPIIIRKFPFLPIIVVTNEGNINTVVNAIKRGAVNYLHKLGLDYELWKQTFKREIDNSRARKRSAELEKQNKELNEQVKRYRAKEDARYPFIGASQAVHEIKRMLEAVAQRPQTNVLITGETGVGKEIAARYLHNHSPRKNKEFVGVNLSAIPEHLLEAQLFGSRKGGYTGAVKDLKGYFEQAQQGILMLDEIGDINSDIQIKLLRFLETRLIRPVGSDKDIELNVQIIAATHQNLNDRILEGTFREDLYQRLKVMKIEIPPLRKRREDIPLLLDHFLSKEGLNYQDINKEAYDKIMQYGWRGNIRELRNAVEHMLLRRSILNIPEINFNCLPEDIRDYDLSGKRHSSFATMKEMSTDEKKALVDLQEIEEALQKTNGKKSDAAKYWNGKKADDMRYRVITIYTKHPHLFEDFSQIQRAYSNIVK